MVALKFLAGLLLLTVLVVFSLQNMEPSVTITYFINKTIGPMPFSFSLLASATIGAVVAALFTLFEQIRLRSLVRKKNKKIEELEEELLEFKSIPPEPLSPDDTILIAQPPEDSDNRGA